MTGRGGILVCLAPRQDRDRPQIVVLVQLHIKQDFGEQAALALSHQAEGSRTEPGCVRFDVGRDQDHLSRLVTIEAFATAADMEYHKAQPHVRAWSDFQHSDSQPIEDKHITRLVPIDWGPVIRTSVVPQLVVVVQLDIKPGAFDDAARVLSASAQGSRREPGCVRFDVLRDRDNASRLVTYEAFATVSDMDYHKAQPHTKAWGEFQYGASEPLVNKCIIRLSPVNFETNYERSRSRTSVH